jgi:hypothetical protein
MKWYIGRKPHETGGDWPDIFKFHCDPTEYTHPGYGHVIGPFKTRITATWFARHRYATFNSMNDAEKVRATFNAREDEVQNG